MKQILLFGGTFDPPHLGHLMMAELALEQIGVEEVWFLPAPLPPHKIGESHRPYEQRVRMTKALVAGCRNMSVSTMEASLPVPSFTVDTVEACQRQYPEFHFRFLIGSDSLGDLPFWHRVHQLVENVRFVVAVRSSHQIQETLASSLRALPKLQVQVIDMPLLDISSLWLRNRLDGGQSVCGLVPDRVLQIWHAEDRGEP